MRIIDEHRNLNGLDHNTIQQSLATGKWYHNHVYILKTDCAYKAVSLNIFDRMMCFLFDLFNKSYLSFRLNEKNVEVLDPTSIRVSLMLASKKTSTIAQQSKSEATPQPSEDVVKSEGIDSNSEVEEDIESEEIECDDPDSEIEEESKIEKKSELTEIEKQVIKESFEIILPAVAYHMFYPDLEIPKEIIKLGELSKLTAFVLDYVQKNAVNNSVDLSIDTFPQHEYLNHFDTLLMITRHLIFNKTIYGYEVDTEKSVIKITLKDQPDLVHGCSFMDRATFIKTIVRPSLEKQFGSLDINTNQKLVSLLE